MGPEPSLAGCAPRQEGKEKVGREGQRGLSAKVLGDDGGLMAAAARVCALLHACWDSSSMKNSSTDPYPVPDPNLPLGLAPALPCCLRFSSARSTRPIGRIL